MDMCFVEFVTCMLSTELEAFNDIILPDDSGFSDESIGELLQQTGDLLCLGNQDFEDESLLSDSSFPDFMCEFSFTDCKVDEFLRDYCPSKLEEALSVDVGRHHQFTNEAEANSCDIFVHSLDDFCSSSSDCQREVEHRFEETASLCHQLQHEFQQPFLRATQEMKPHETYIELIVRAILSTPHMKMNLPEIYTWITNNYPYFLTAPKTWKNAVRHNLSMNEFFRKSGRAGNGRGSFWNIHPACIAAFQMGDYRRREARQRAMVADEEAKREQFRKSIMLSPSTSAYYSSQSKGFIPTSYSMSAEFQPMTSTPLRTQEVHYHQFNRC